MDPISFFAPGEPKGQPRPRAFAFKGRARVYDPGTAEGFKSAIATAAREWEGRLFPGPFEVTIKLWFPRPKGHYGAKGTLKPSAPHHHTGKPDLDNVAKAILDTLSEKSGIGLWKDDNAVIRLTISKHWADALFPTGAQVEIYAMPTPNGNGGR